MRTERKHGYIVFASPYPILEQGGLAFIVQSPATPSQVLLDESLEFIKEFVDRLKAMEDSDFESHQQGLINNLVKKPLNLQEKTNRLWRDIDRENYQFDTMDEIAHQVSLLSKQDIIQYLQTHIIGEKKKASAFYFDPSQP